jgi:hypothetical protein
MKCIHMFAPRTQDKHGFRMSRLLHVFSAVLLTHGTSLFPYPLATLLYVWAHSHPAANARQPHDDLTLPSRDRHCLNANERASERQSARERRSEEAECKSELRSACVRLMSSRVTNWPESRKVSQRAPSLVYTQHSCTHAPHNLQERENDTW